MTPSVSDGRPITKYFSVSTSNQRASRQTTVVSFRRLDVVMENLKWNRIMVYHYMDITTHIISIVVKDSESSSKKYWRSLSLDSTGHRFFDEGIVEIE
ncbi:hypothetical protein TYRP_019900 [Tyrophagus putrescentiae]|nr:hypothetical protein TYRP_019900 [Tyrophagus putrescentiae]